MEPELRAPRRRRQVVSRARRDIQRPPQTATSDVAALFDRMRTLASPARVDGTWARNFGLEAGALTVLEWLGVTNAGEVNAEAWNALRLPNTRADAIAAAVRTSYEPIFQQVDVESASKADLGGAFINTYRMGDPARYVRLFQYLCRLAGISSELPTVADAPRTREGVGRVTTSRATVDARLRHESEGAVRKNTERSDRFTISINLDIPADKGEDWVRDRIRMIVSVVQSLT